MIARKLFGFVLLIGLAGLAGCARTQVQTHHFLVQANTSAPHAKVYFLRPGTERAMGIADNAVKVELDRRPLITLVKGEYVLVDLKPGPVELTIKSLTNWGPHSMVKEMSGSHDFNFAEGGTYFIVISPVDGEFRGVFFQPEEADLFKAKEISKHLRPVGKARKAPIPGLKAER
ncbi:MAG TPA: hypothetical protein VIH66_04845 [Gammaproteobacteria bacterium]